MSCCGSFESVSATPISTDPTSRLGISNPVRLLSPETALNYTKDTIWNGAIALKRGAKKISRRTESAIEQIISRVTSQEIEEKNWLEQGKFQEGTPSRPPIESGNKVVLHPRSKVITIPMSAVPPRVQVPGTSKGMPSTIRIVEIHQSHQSFLQRIFRRSIMGPGPGYAATKPPNHAQSARGANKSRKHTYSVDLRGGIVGVGEYYSVIQLGRKDIRVQIDTGSSTLAVPMSGCKSCIPKANRYSAEESTRANSILCDSPQCATDRCTVNCPVCSSKGACCSSERPNECGFSLRYADGSAASGSLITDEMHWSMLRANVTFGGILSNSPNFERPEVDGILGMAYKSLACNPSCFEPPFDAFVSQGLVDDIFSICMTATSGKLMLGGYLPSVAKTPVQYVPLYLSDPPRYYRVRLPGYLQIGEDKLALPNFKTAIVDTGTTLIVTSTRTFAAIREYFQTRHCAVPELCGEDSWFQSGMCVSLAMEDLAKLPSISFNVEGQVDLVLAPEDYMLEYKRGSRTYRCVGMMGMDGLGGMVVLGNTLMQRYVTVYDRVNSRLGFAEVAPNCGD